MNDVSQPMPAVNRPRTFLTVMFGLVVLPVLAAAQGIEAYISQKNAEKQQPNSFLSGESPNNVNPLMRYYKKAFSEQRLGGAFQFGPDMNGSTQTPSAKLGLVAALDGAIDPSEYIVGPLDMLAINIWADIPSTYTGYVTPEGSVLVPTVGEINVRNLSLKQTKETISREIEKKYPKVKATVTLVAPRSFSVHVTGIVGAPGAYEVSAGDRADKAIYMANLTRAVKELEKQKARSGMDAERTMSFTDPPEQTDPVMSMRNILLLRGPDTLRVDLLRYYAGGDVRANPRLLDGDVLVVQPEELESNTVSVYGGVKLTGRFEYCKGDSLGLLLRIAQGYKENAIADSIDIVRFTGTRDGITTIRVGSDAVNQPGKDIALERGDRVFVRETHATRQQHTVTIRGEVRYVGSYPISRDRTTLSEIIQRAGGFTENAAVAEGTIFRKDPNVELDPMRKVPDYRRLAEMRLTDLDVEEREYYTYETAIRRNTVAADFERLFIRRDAAADITLRDGDEIVVPATQNTVYVYGQVRRPGHVTYVDGMDEDYYVERAGGFSEAANSGEVKVIKAGSNAWESAGDSRIGAGDALFVPRKKDRGFVFYFTALRDFLQITVSVITVYLLFVQIRRN
jgi:polysaccharide biosynthesis/export protein